jgi:Amt family ammonium transporter
VLRATGLAPELLQLEITESAAMADADGAVTTLRQLKGLGVRIAIDDFGTGYSSLGYLQRFPVDLLKIDHRFVGGLARDEGDAAIVRAVVGLAHTLGLRVVAEGVETAEQSQRLRELGCELAQGFLFGRPVPAEDIPPLLAKVTYAAAHSRGA